MGLPGAHSGTRVGAGVVCEPSGTKVEAPPEPPTFQSPGRTLLNQGRCRLAHQRLLVVNRNGRVADRQEANHRGQLLVMPSLAPEPLCPPDPLW